MGRLYQFFADIHAVFIGLTYVCRLQRFWQWWRWLSSKMLATMPHIQVQFLLVLKLSFFPHFLHFSRNAGRLPVKVVHYVNTVSKCDVQMYSNPNPTHPNLTPSLGTNLIHDFTAVTFSVKLAFFREKCPFPCLREIHDFSWILTLLLSLMKVFRVLKVK